MQRTAPPEGWLGLREENQTVKEHATRPDAAELAMPFAGRFRAALGQGAACLPAGHAIADSRPNGWHPQASSLEGALLALSQQTPSTEAVEGATHLASTPSTEAVEGATHLASPTSNLLSGLLPSRRDGFIGLVQGPSSPPSERRPYHGTTPYLRPGPSPVRSSVAREIGPIRRIRLISFFSPPKPNTEHPSSFPPPTIWPESLWRGAFGREGLGPFMP